MSTRRVARLWLIAGCCTFSRVAARVTLRSSINASMTRPATATEDLMIPSDIKGIQQHVRRKRRAGQDHFSAERTVLMMHGATFPSASLFDVPVGGGSFMDDLAGNGLDVYALAVRGYGDPAGEGGCGAGGSSAAGPNGDRGARPGYSGQLRLA
jgi:hypothetical protein